MDKLVALILVLASFGFCMQVIQVSSGPELTTWKTRSDRHVETTTAKIPTTPDRYIVTPKWSSNQQIILITPTRQRPERMADLTMLSQTLTHLQNIHWIVVEDGDATVPMVEQLLQRTNIPHTYLQSTNNGLPCRGWAHRNLALQYLRENRANFAKYAVIYFADDDNGYDLRLFDNYVRQVWRVGIWAVGLPGFGLHGPVEAPKVENSRVVGWLTAWRPERKFATDMAGFAVNLDLVLKSGATFNLHCAGTMPEDCFLSQLNITMEQLEPFGYNEPKEILVWHRKTADSQFVDHSSFGYNFEQRLPKSKKCDQFYNIHDMDYETVEKIAKSENL
ncbi:unnamed protein product [Bursaphelenchus xylophilus]|uniref:Galactosylgalactosylxylosylprotein 3-beta-glucuronosyltransferase n=1 Tax=Bursaphelenchus xylophilus TaxID=6326 RepID=A0A1I7SVI0_BURXY|nr:unnamed protein product [Bursaphelenchus xylophilus]CAG9101484.1 unnamed protein product [Bursaphelenchus xylophilus]